MTDDEIIAVGHSLPQNKPLNLHDFARAIIAAHEAKLREGVEVPKTQWLGDIPGFTISQLLAYGDARALAARDAAIEECAKVCDELDKESQSQWPQRIATIIRALKRGEA